MTMTRALAVAGMAVALAGCSHRQWGLPRVAMSATSPDGRWVAFARNHVSIDPPEQTIWLGPTAGRAVELRKLGPDTEEISAIVWSADSRRVGFLTNDAILGVYEADTRARIASGYLRYPNVNYPPKYMVKELVFSADGASVSYVPCERTYDRLSPQDRWIEHTTCASARDTREVADLARQQAELHPRRSF